MSLNADSVSRSLLGGNIAVAAIYWILSALWLIILVVFFVQYKRSRKSYPAVSILLIVLAIDSSRTLFESVYFGFFFDSNLGVLAPQIQEFLGKPVLLIIPKIFNGLSGLLILFILAARLVPIVRTESKKFAEQEKQVLERQLFEKLQQEHDRLVAIQSIVKLGSWETNPTTFDVTWSPETFRIFGLSPDKFYPTHNEFLSRVHPEDRKAVDAAFQGSLGETEPRCIEHRIVMPDNSIKVVVERWQSYRAQDGSLERILGTCQDVTEQRSYQTLLQQKQRLESIGQLTGGIAHDFNNLLTVILGNSEILSRPKLSKDEISHAANTITLAAERGSDLVYRLLIFAKKQFLRPQIIDMNTLIEGIEILRTAALSENIEFKKFFAKDLWLVNIDALQMENAILNLYINARDAMPSGGTLIVETSNVILGKDISRNRPDANPGEYVSVKVSDTGTGIESQALGRVFEPFFTTKAPNVGVGLGLSIVHGFIKQSLGHISVSSELGSGSVFEILIPRVQGVQPIVPSKDLVRFEDLGSASILVVEDDNLVREHAILILKDRGHRVTAVETGDRAVEALRGKEHFDLVFTDLIMPGRIDGFELVRIAAALRPGIALIATSGFAMENAQRYEGLIKNAGFIAKPYRSADLARKIEEALEKSHST